MKTGIELIEKATRELSRLRVTLGLFFLFIILTVYLQFNNISSYGFAEEIGNVAASVINGGGFANVFDESSGPTAWCPPLYVGYYAFIFMIFGVKTTSAAWAIYLTRCIFLALTYYFIAKIDYQQFTRYKLLLIPIYLLYAVIVLVSKKADDVFIHVFISSVLIYQFSIFVNHGFNKERAPMFILALLIPFTNISFFVGMLVLMLAMIFIKMRSLGNHRPFIRLSLVIILIMFAGATVWGTRNSVVLNQFIPFKSNLWFELYLANVMDDDGISKWSNFRKYHPLGNELIRNQYKSAGEVEFLNSYKEISIDYLKHNPWDFTKKVTNRLCEAFLFTTSQKDTDLAAIDAFNPVDIIELQEHGMLVSSYWVSLEEPEEKMVRQLEGLGLKNYQPVKDDWTKKAKLAKQRISKQDSLKEFLRSLLVSIVPFVFILVGFLIKSIRHHKVFILTAVFYAFSIGPYILISFLPRYIFFQTAFFVLFIFLVLSFVIDLSLNKHHMPGEIV